MKHALGAPKYITLGLDPARRSGWSIFDCGEFRVCGPASHAHEREDVISIAVRLAHDKGIPLVVGVEDWSLHGEWGRAQIFGMGAGWGRWEHILEREGYDKRLLFRVQVNVWRKAMLGLPPRTKRDDAKAAALRYCKGKRWKAESDDAAEAAVIGFYFTKNPDVHKQVRLAQKRMDLALRKKGLNR